MRREIGFAYNWVAHRLPQWHCLFLAASCTFSSLPLGAVERLFDEGPRLQSLGLATVAADAKRGRQTRINHDLLGDRAGLRQPMGRVNLNLFPGIEPVGILGRIDSLGADRWSGTGHIENEPGSQFVIAVSGRSVAATVFIPSKGHFRILPQGAQSHVILEIDPDRSGECGLCRRQNQEARPDASNGGGAKPAPRALDGRADAEPAILNVPHPVEPAPRVSLLSIAPEQPPLVMAKVSIIDLMVMYTPAALDGAGGTEAMNALIDLATAEANTIHQNSQTTARFRVVHRGLVDYQEAPNLATNLSRLQADGDGFLDEIHPVRLARQADIVCLITESADPGLSGLAFMMSDTPSVAFRGFAFAVVKRAGAVGGGYAFTHELAHVMGCQHDRDNSLNAKQELLFGSHPYSFGHRFIANGTTYRTVMAYNPGIPIPYFSNPNLTYLGARLGIADAPGVTNAADNAKTISLNAGTVSAFLGPVTQTFPPQVNLLSPTVATRLRSGEDAVLSASASDSDGSVAQVEFFADARLIGVATSSPYSLVWSNVPAGDYLFTARAVDNLGASSAASAARVAVRPKNDEFESPTSLAGTSPAILDSNRAATREANEPNHVDNPGGSSIWYRWTVPKSGSVRLLVRAIDFSPLPGIYKGESLAALKPVSKLTKVASETALSEFDVEVGASYFIAVDGAGGDSGIFDLNLNYLEPPRNDDFASRTTLIGADTEIRTQNDFATTETGEPALYSGNPGGKSVWFEWIAPRTGSVIVTGKGFGFLVLQDVYTTLGAPTIADLKVVPSRRFTSNTAEETTSLFFDAQAGQNYSLAVASLGGASGSFELKLTMPQPPSNDDFVNGKPLSGLSLAFDSTTTYATTEPGETNHGGQQTGKSVWYHWTAPRAGLVLVATRGHNANFFPITDAYVGSAITNLATVPGRTIGLVVSNQTSTVRFVAASNQTYSIVVAGFSGVTGEFSTSLEMPAPPANDDFANRVPQAGGLWSVSAVNRFATSEPGEPKHAGNPGGTSIWYSWTAPVSGLVTLTATGEGFLVLVDVYTGETLSSLKTVSRSIRFPTTNFVTTLSFNALYSTNYLIALDGFNGRTGANELSLTAPNVPPSLLAPNRASFTSSDFLIEIAGSAGTKFVVQSSTNLETWTELLTASFLTERFRFSDTSAPSIPIRFYRVLPRP